MMRPSTTASGRWPVRLRTPRAGQPWCVTVDALSNSEMTPSNCRISLADGVSSRNAPGLSAAIRSTPRSLRNCQPVS